MQKAITFANALAKKKSCKSRARRMKYYFHTVTDTMEKPLRKANGSVKGSYKERISQNWDSLKPHILSEDTSEMLGVFSDRWVITSMFRNHNFDFFFLKYRKYNKCNPTTNVRIVYNYIILVKCHDTSLKKGQHLTHITLTLIQQNYMG